QDSIRRDESEDFDVDKAQEETKKKRASGTIGAFNSSQAPPPPPLSSSTHQGDQSTSTAARSSSKTAASAEYSAWTTTDTPIKPSITMIPDDLYMDDETTADEQAYSSGDEVGLDHIPIINLRQNDISYLHRDTSLLAQTGDIATFMDWYYKRQGISELTPKDWKPAYEFSRPALSISKMKAAFYPDVGLEQLVPDQFWIEEECKYDIAAINLVIRQRVEEFQLGIESYQTQLNLTKPRWDATGFEFKHDYTVIDSPRAVIFKDRYGIDKALGTMSQRVQSQQDKSRDEYKILDTERRCQKQGVHVRYPERAKDTTYLPESGELCEQASMETFDGYTSDDPILQLEICRRCRLKRIYLITGSSYGGNGLPRSSLLSTENTTARGDSMMEDDQDDLAERADSGLQSHWDTVFIEEELCLNSNMTWRTIERQWSVDIDRLDLLLDSSSQPDINEFSLGVSWVDTNAEAQLFLTFDTLEDGMVQAGLGMEEEEAEETKKILMLLKYLVHQMRLLEEVEEVAINVETQEEFLVTRVSFFFFLRASSGFVGVDMSNHRSNTFEARQQFL
ncbi:hypothetical protein Tco_0360883, partial [Tanacetum coccineum]